MCSVLIVFLFIFFVDCTNSEVATDEVTTQEPIIYMVRSKYEEWMNLLNEIPIMREKQHFERKETEKQRSVELKAKDKVRHDIYLKIYHQKVSYETDLWKHKRLKNTLFYFRYLTILQNHIDDYERLTLNFEPDIDQVKRNYHTKIDQAGEIRRQRWNYILNHCSGFQIIRDLIDNIDKAGIHHSDFSRGIARGYKMLMRYLRPNKIQEITPMRFLPDFSKNITGDFEVDKCFIVLMG